MSSTKRTKEVGEQLMQIMQKMSENAIECAKDPHNYGDYKRKQVWLENELANVFSDTEKKPMQAKSWSDGDGDVSAVAWDVDKDQLH